MTVLDRPGYKEAQIELNRRMSKVVNEAIFWECSAKEALSRGKKETLRQRLRSWIEDKRIDLSCWICGGCE